MHPKYLSINDFNYELPDGRIATYPLPQRDLSKLLIYRNDAITEDIYKSIADHIPAQSLLVFNNTKVVAARLVFYKATGTPIEIFCLEPHERYEDITTAMLQKEKVWWKCLVGGAKKWKEPLLLKKIPHAASFITLRAKKMEQRNDYYVIELDWDDRYLSFAEILHLAGQVPLPPYIHRDAEETDKERYQTIYATYEGSVAAPTAGLHFTPHLFEQFALKNIEHSFVTLHVGAGTFKPVKAETMQLHEMHAEFMEVTKQFIENLAAHRHAVIAVGTTSLRTIESLYWLGVKTIRDPSVRKEDLFLAQWEAYEWTEKNITAADALTSLLTWMNLQQTTVLIVKTQIIIAPGYTFRIIDALITNFHQPKSTLLLLVAALTGEHWKKIYDYALAKGFRFLSYGDGSLLWNDQKGK